MTKLFNTIGQTNQSAKLTRVPMRWHSPVFGQVEMYLNPQDVSISNKKISTSTRTKGGFVYQYAGEDLTKISIAGTTGSSGIEGINVLEAVYRSEQIGFKQIASQLESDAATQSITNVVDQALISVFQSAGIPVAGLSLNYATQPFPTLASLATAVEMEWHNVIYRGYFESFTVNEAATTVGLFDYRIEFTAFAKQGIRTNFMPWHRSPSSTLNSSDTSNYSIGQVTSDEVYNSLNATPAQPDPIDQNQLSGKAIKISRATVLSSVDLITKFNT